MVCFDCGIPLHSDRMRCPGCTLQRVMADQRQPATAEWFDREPEREVRRFKRRAAMAQRALAAERAENSRLRGLITDLREHVAVDARGAGTCYCAGPTSNCAGPASRPDCCHTRAATLMAKTG